MKNVESSFHALHLLRKQKYIKAAGGVGGGAAGEAARGAAGGAGHHY